MAIRKPMRRLAVVAPHPDDEILGCGGTMARALREGADVHVVVVTRGQPPQFDPALVDQIRQETLAAHANIGITRTHFLDLPAAGLDLVASTELNRVLSDVLSDIAPDTLFVPFVGDIHHDHQAVFTAALVWARPRGPTGPATVLAYETLSETNWLAPGITPGFLPNVFIDISDTIDLKITAFECFVSQMKEAPDERALATIRALAAVRGATVYRAAAEAFMAVRQVL